MPGLMGGRMVRHTTLALMALSASLALQAITLRSALGGDGACCCHCDKGDSGVQCGPGDINCVLCEGEGHACTTADCEGDCHGLPACVCGKPVFTPTATPTATATATATNTATV